MNERIRELAEQCYNLPNITEALYYRKFDEEKFAELIVQECMKSVAETPFGYKDYRSQIEEDMRNACVDEIKQHFGVE